MFLSCFSFIFCLSSTDTRFISWMTCLWEWSFLCSYSCLVFGFIWQAITIFLLDLHMLLPHFQDLYGDRKHNMAAFNIWQTMWLLVPWLSCHLITVHLLSSIAHFVAPTSYFFFFFEHSSGNEAK